MASSSQAHVEHPVAEDAAAHERRIAESPHQIERRVTVPVVDEFEPGRVVYDPAMARLALFGAAVGMIALGVIGSTIASGVWPFAEFGQFSAGGAAVGTFTAAGIGAALGGLSGALAALYRIPGHKAHQRKH